MSSRRVKGIQTFPGGSRPENNDTLFQKVSSAIGYLVNMFKQFLSELRRRRVLRTAVAYAVIAAAMVEFTDIVTPALGLPEGLLRAVIIISLVGFPVIIVLSWFFDLTSGGVVRGVSSPQPAQSRRTQAISIMLIGVLGIAVAYLSYRLYWESQDQAGFDRGMSIAVLPFDSISGWLPGLPHSHSANTMCARWGKR